MTGYRIFGRFWPAKNLVFVGLLELRQLFLNSKTKECGLKQC